MGAIHRAGFYLLFGIPGFLMGGAFQTDMEREAERKKPFYVENEYLGGIVVHGFDNLKDARAYAVKHTVGMYRMNGVLNDNVARIFVSGTHTETIRSGLTESEYEKAADERKDDGAGKKEAGSVVSFSWNR
ncbi:MAG: hypothetical protein FWH44_03740 [Methanomassiliicoccaceae archaeon]|nr:hypothetical protein [Methanomassiliicoccaceae archaeon]